jgi:molybdopterin converting factor small subunit
MRFRFSGTLLRFTDYQKEIAVEAPTLKAGLDQLIAKYPELNGALFNRLGQLRASHRFFVNGDPVADVNQAAGAEDVVDIITAITGG